MLGNLSNHQIDSDLYLNDNVLNISDGSNTGGTKFLYLNGVIADWAGSPPGPAPFLPTAPPPILLGGHNITLSGNAAGPFVVQVSGANTFTGSTVINTQVTLDLRNASGLGAAANQTTVNAGGTLQFTNAGGPWSVAQSNVTISGAGAPGTGGALYNALGSNSLDTSVLYVNNDTTIGVANGTTLTVQNPAALFSQSIVKMSNSAAAPATLTLDTAGPGAFLDLNAPLYQTTGGPFSVLKTGVGIARLSGYDSGSAKYTGSLNVAAGMLEAVVSEDIVVAGTYGNSALGTSSGNTLVQNGATLAFHNTTGTPFTFTEDFVRIYGSGSSPLYGALHNETGDNTLNVTGGLLHVASDSRISADNASTFSVNGPVDLYGDLTLDTLNTSQIFLNGIVSNGMGVHGIIKTGDGMAYLGGNNSFDGEVRVELGTLWAFTNFSLGNPTVGVNATTVLIHSTLAMQGGITIAGEELRLAGSGDPLVGAYGGALRGDGGNNYWLGNISLYDHATIASAVGGDSLTLLGGVPTLDLQSWDVTFHGSGEIYVDGQIIGNGGVIKQGGGTTVLGVTPGGGASFANTYTGDTTVNAGTLELRKDPGVDAIANGTVRVNGGSLLLGNDDQINNSVNMELNGGTFSTGSGSGFNETLGTLTLSSSSTLDLGTGVHQLAFNDSSANPWTGTLTIDGWTGTAGSSGTQGQIFFAGMGLTTGQLAQITFTGFTPGAQFVGFTDEITPTAIPEPATIAVGLLLLGGIGWRERRRLMAGWDTLRRQTWQTRWLKRTCSR